MQAGGTAVPLPVPVTTLPLMPLAAIRGVVRVARDGSRPQRNMRLKISARVFGELKLVGEQRVNGDVVELNADRIYGRPLLLAPWIATEPVATGEGVRGVTPEK